MPSAQLLGELGSVLLALAILGRIAGRFGYSPVPLYLLSGLAFGEGGLLPLGPTEDFIEVGAEIGAVLLLFALGLEYSVQELTATLRSSSRTGMVDAALNFTPGFAMGLLLGWDTKLPCCSAGSPGSPLRGWWPSSSPTWAASETGRRRRSSASWSSRTWPWPPTSPSWPAC